MIERIYEQMQKQVHELALIKQQDVDFFLPINDLHWKLERAHILPYNYNYTHDRIDSPCWVQKKYIEKQSSADR